MMPRRDCPSPCCAASVAAKNQKYAEPTQTDWNPVFHFAGPMAPMTTTRAAPRAGERRHEHLAAKHDRDDPPRKAHVAQWRAEREAVSAHRSDSFVGADAGLSRRRHEHVHRNQRRDEQQLVGERIEQPAEVGDQVPRARELAVEVVGDRRDDEERRTRAARANGESMNGSAAMSGATAMRPTVIAFGRFTDSARLRRATSARAC